MGIKPSCVKCGSRLPRPRDEILAGKSELSPGCLRILAFVGVCGCWVMGFPILFNIIVTIAGIIVFVAAKKISKRG
jgi:hypothetical protein